MRILIVEDERSLRDGLQDLVSTAGHEVETAEDGEVALSKISGSAFDAVLLDLMLPKVDGLEVCRRVKERHPSLYVLMLTARGSEDDKVTGLKTGADDYITKPFGSRELLARLESVERRLAPPEWLSVGDAVLDLGRCQFRRGDEICDLTARESAILKMLYHHRERAISRAELLEHVWDAPGNLETRTVDMTISNLRQKIETNPSTPNIVVTVKGVGYAWGLKTS